jgi:hypothetical protein
MSVQMIENWADVLGEVLEVMPISDLADFDQVVLLVQRIEPVEDYPNLVETYLQEAGEPRLVVLVPVEVVLTYQITQGVLLACRVRRAGPDRVIIHRQHVQVLPPDAG